jgi:hypothetical protein
MVSKDIVYFFFAVPFAAFIPATTFLEARFLFCIGECKGSLLADAPDRDRDAAGFFLETLLLACFFAPRMYVLVDAISFGLFEH